MIYVTVLRTRCECYAPQCYATYGSTCYGNWTVISYAATEIKLNIYKHYDAVLLFSKFSF